MLGLAMAICISSLAMAQDSTMAMPAKKKNITAADHFMVQVAHNIWQGVPDSVSDRIKGFNRSANVYVMLNKPFKNNQKLALAFGIGIGTSNIYFDKTIVDVAGTTPVLRFINADSLDNFKKYKVSTAHVEVPVEFRFSSKPESPNQSVKFALGLKGGFLVSAKTKGTKLLNKDGAQINDFTQKIISSSYFNSNKIAATARVGYGIVSLFGSYNLNSVFKTGVVDDTKLIQVGLTISGL